MCVTIACFNLPMIQGGLASHDPAGRTNHNWASHVVYKTSLAMVRLPCPTFYLQRYNYSGLYHMDTHGTVVAYNWDEHYTARSLAHVDKRRIEKQSTFLLALCWMEERIHSLYHHH